jgi:uncharacterized protein
MTEYAYDALVFLAGFIDSIAGGGGLITVPILTLLLGPGAVAIGTNKIVGLAAALIALIVYARKGHLQIKSSAPFLIGIALGTISGSKLAMHLPKEYFQWFLLAACPVILFITLKRESFLTKEHSQPSLRGRRQIALVAFLGAACGFYDGVFGPGGGTFMFLSLAGIGGYSVVAALATSKLANTLSAASALGSFALEGVVVWDVGLRLALFAGLGALIGSQIASKNAKVIVRPMLVIVVVILLTKLAFDI